MKQTLSRYNECIDSSDAAVVEYGKGVLCSAPLLDFIVLDLLHIYDHQNYWEGGLFFFFQITRGLLLTISQPLLGLHLLVTEVGEWPSAHME
ncbi:hypothetical protein RIF29_40252 [Crotalaria pallida]|uniref:Uncharacterized protein n=1 Tax=Crotalaria pallida TaxID=3830 RepID=A0AAN9E5U1_CROPI